MHFKIFPEITENFRIPVSLQASDTEMNCRQICVTYWEQDTVITVPTNDKGQVYTMLNLCAQDRNLKRTTRSFVPLVG